MTHHVAHTNQMVSDLKQQYQNHIEQLQNKIAEQEDEISRLKQQIQNMDVVVKAFINNPKDKIYDC